MEKEIEAFTIKVVERELPAPQELHNDLWRAFRRTLDMVPAEDREKFEEQFRDLSMGMRKATSEASE